MGGERMRACGKYPSARAQQQQPGRKFPTSKPVPAGKRKLERGHFPQSNCISPESTGRRLIEENDFSFCLERVYLTAPSCALIIAPDVKRNGVPGMS
jgi:hypothetical protein